MIVDQSVSNIVVEDYNYINPDGTTTKILSKYTKPTKLFLTLEINLKRRIKKKEEIE
jgi:hypothetical protein